MAICIIGQDIARTMALGGVPVQREKGKLAP